MLFGHFHLTFLLKWDCNELEWVLNPVTGVHIRRPYEDTDIEERIPGKYEGRDWSDTSISQRTSEMTATTRSQERSVELILL